jgi:hypothetical protein
VRTKVKTPGTGEIMVEEAVQISTGRGCANFYMERQCKLHYSQSRVMPGPQKNYILSCGVYQWKRVDIRKEGKRVYMVNVFCIHIILENRRMKPVEIVLRREGEGYRENDGGGKSN